ncbi:hypothetical protein TI39_contig4142g00001 [Zymoseptoria brevis]|uniref:Uncharacterized protein n=1 Tax=Zymoseptoria brevis TaxID=1047168 RepID=A0A0F4GCB8_9PEZI|nr:hypothetical protein TI39_contig4142g00001 [Zymoseptoria brevis]
MVRLFLNRSSTDKPDAPQSVLDELPHGWISPVAINNLIRFLAPRHVCVVDHDMFDGEASTSTLAWPAQHHTILIAPMVKNTHLAVACFDMLKKHIELYVPSGHAQTYSNIIRELHAFCREFLCPKSALADTTWAERKISNIACIKRAADLTKLYTTELSSCPLRISICHAFVRVVSKACASFEASPENPLIQEYVHALEKTSEAQRKCAEHAIPQTAVPENAIEGVKLGVVGTVRQLDKAMLEVRKLGVEFQELEAEMGEGLAAGGML